MAANPRIEELRKRLEKSPDSRLFAQLAEELRKGGELDEAIRVCRDGLGKHPNYPSARMTLGRALLDKGDVPAARQEFGAVLKGAPDNILAGRFLGECLEGLEEHEAALAQYKQTLILAPGDEHLTERVAVLEKRLAERKPEAGPIPVAAAEEGFEVEKAFESPTTQISEKSPPRTPVSMAVPVVQVEEDFELERPLPGGRAEPPTGAAAPQAQPTEAVGKEPAERGRPKTAPVPMVQAEASFELEEAYASPPTKISEAPPPRSPESVAIPLAQVEEAVELTRPAPGGVEQPPAAPEHPGRPAPEPGRKGTAPIPMVEAEASFEVEEAYASPPTKISETPPPRSPESVAIPLAQVEEAVKATQPDAGEGESVVPEPAASLTEQAEQSEEDLEVEGFWEAGAGEPEVPAAEAVPPDAPEALPVASEGAAPAEVAVPPAPAPDAPAALPAAPEKPAEAARAEVGAPSRAPGAPPPTLPEPGSETVAMPSLPPPPPPRRTSAAMAPKSRVAEISPEHAAAAMGELAGGKTIPLTSATLAELYVSQGAPEKAVDIYEKLLADRPGDEQAAARLAELKAAKPSSATARVSSREVRRAALQLTIERLEALLAAIRERKVSQ